MPIYLVYRQARGADALVKIFFSEKKAQAFCTKNDWHYVERSKTDDKLPPITA